MVMVGSEAVQAGQTDRIVKSIDPIDCLFAGEALLGNHKYNLARDKYTAALDYITGLPQTPEMAEDYDRILALLYYSRADALRLIALRDRTSGPLNDALADLDTLANLCHIDPEAVHRPNTSANPQTEDELLSHAFSYLAARGKGFIELTRAEITGHWDDTTRVTVLVHLQKANTALAAGIMHEERAQTPTLPVSDDQIEWDLYRAAILLQTSQRLNQRRQRDPLLQGAIEGILENPHIETGHASNPTPTPVSLMERYSLNEAGPKASDIFQLEV